MSDQKLKTNPNEEEESKGKKLLFIILGSILGAGAIAGASVGIYFAAQPKVPQYKVSCEVNGVTLSKSKATKGKEFNAEIGINEQMIGEGYTLPTTLTKVVSGEYEVKTTEYTYDLKEENKKADFKIPGEYVKGDIKIELTLVEPGPVLDPLLTIEYEYQDTTDNDTVGFLLANQDGSEVTFDWGDGSDLETVVPSTDYEEMLEGSPITHRYKEKPKIGNTYTITVSGDLAVFHASSKDFEGEEYDCDLVIRKGNFYFKSATLYKNFSTLDLMSNEAISVCALGGFKENSTASEWSNISQISFGDEVTIIPYDMVAYSKIESVTIPNQITTILSHAFGDTKLNEVIFEEDSALETIGDSAFYDCDNLQVITIPHSVKTIGSQAFYRCNKLWVINLHEFTIDDDVPEISDNTFSTTDDLNQRLSFVSKTNEMNQKFRNAWSSHLSECIFADFGYGAGLIYEENEDPSKNVYAVGLTSMLNANTSLVFSIQNADGDSADKTKLTVTNNLGTPMAMTYDSGAKKFTINSSQYLEGMVWVKVTYRA